MIRGILAGLAGLFLIGPALADTFPSRPITMIVVFAAGGPTDVMARIAADHMSRTLGQRIVIENVTGGGGTTGGARGARAEPDGYTLTVGSLGSHGASAALVKSMPYDTRELEPIGVIAGTPGYVAVRKDFPARTLQEFVAYAKENPGKVTSGHAGVASTPHLSCLLFSHLTGLKLVSAAYRGSAPAVNDLVAGQIDQMCDLAPTLVPQIQAGSVRALAVALKERSAATPDVPTSAEAGLPDYLFSGWNAIFAPKGTPKPVVDKLAEALKAALADETVRKRIVELGSVPPPPAEQGPEALRQLVLSEMDRWSRVVQAAGVAPQ